MKKFAVRFLGISLFFSAAVMGLQAQSSLTTGSAVTKVISAKNDGVTVDVKTGSVSYDFSSKAKTGSSLTSDQSGTIAEPMNKSTTADLRFNKPGSASITLTLNAACDACATVTLTPDGTSPATITKESTSSADRASIDIKSGGITYQVYYKTDANSDFILDPGQSGTAPAPKDKNLVDDIVIAKTDTYEIKVVVTAATDDSAVVIFK